MWDTVVLIARLALALMFLVSGQTALSDIDATSGYFAGLGLQPSRLFAWGVGLFELAAGTLLVIGLLTRATAIVLALFSVAATWLGHYDQGGDNPVLVFMHLQMLLKDVAVAGGLLVLAAHGGGRLAMDAWRAGQA